MPEMPEVEQVRKSLEPHIQGKRICRVEISLPRMILRPSVAEFIAGIKGRVITGVSRRGKYLLLELGGADVILTHLRMTGALLVTLGQEAEPPYARIHFTLTDGMHLWFADARTFGTMSLLTRDTLSLDKGYAALGPEPLSEGFTPEYLRAVLQKSHQAIKSLLLDQRKIAGVGNIYADEALAVAGICPLRPADRLTGKQCLALHEAVNQVIAQGLKNHGTTFRNYQDANGEIGNNKDFLLVYGRKGQPCRSCGRPLKQIRVGGRGSVYCPHCQK